MSRPLPPPPLSGPATSGWTFFFAASLSNSWCCYRRNNILKLSFLIGVHTPSLLTYSWCCYRRNNILLLSFLIGVQNPSLLYYNWCFYWRNNILNLLFSRGIHNPSLHCTLLPIIGAVIRRNENTPIWCFLRGVHNRSLLNHNLYCIEEMNIPKVFFKRWS